MIESVVDYLNTQIQTLNVFKEVHGVAQRVDERNSGDDLIRSYPAIYSGKDSLKFVTNYDFRSGVLWHQRNGEVGIEQLERIIATSANIQQTHPMRLYAIHRKAYNDTQYSADEILANLIHKVNQRNINSLRTSLALNRIVVEVTGTVTGVQLLDEVFTNVDIKFKHELDIMAITYNIILQGNQNCFINYNC